MKRSKVPPLLSATGPRQAEKATNLIQKLLLTATVTRFLARSISLLTMPSRFSSVGQTTYNQCKSRGFIRISTLNLSINNNLAALIF
jgi:hypothetical protein